MTERKEWPTSMDRRLEKEIHLRLRQVLSKRMQGVVMGAIREAWEVCYGVAEAVEGQAREPGVPAEVGQDRFAAAELPAQREPAEGRADGTRAQ